jgi:hypothetical protein
MVPRGRRLDLSFVRTKEAFSDETRLKPFDCSISVPSIHDLHCIALTMAVAEARFGRKPSATSFLKSHVSWT